MKATAVRRSRRIKTIGERTGAWGRVSKIGVIGGTFDPIHYGHLFAAEEARSQLGLERVIFVPSGTPPHKRYDDMATAEERYEMTLLAISDSFAPQFDITRIEIERSGKSYTLDTLRELKRFFSRAEIHFIVGLDAILDIMSWHEPYKIAEAAQLTVVSRPGYPRDKIEELPAEIRKSTTLIDSLQLDISGTDLRKRIRSGRSVKYLLPDPVWTYIQRNRLYRTDNLNDHPDGDAK